MATKNKQETENDRQEGSTEKYQRQENDPERDDQYTDDQGEDENGRKPSADAQD